MDAKRQDVEDQVISKFTKQPAGKKKRDGKADGTDDKDGRTSTAKALVELAMKSCTLFHDERKDGYAVTTIGDVRRTLKLRGKDFRRWLSGSYYASTKKAANSEAISSALSVIEAQATFDGRELELSNRFAMRDGCIYIDLGDPDWRVIEVTPDGWEIMNKPPVLFRRYSHQKALPVPVRGGKLSDLHEFLAIKSEDDKRLMEAWLVAAFFPNVPRPASTFHGPQGASKTTSARILKAVTDPSLIVSVDFGKSPADLAQVLDHHGVPCFDNLTSIPAWAADTLCRAVTGGAFSKREHYSDDSDILMVFQRPIIITGINIPTHAPDLLDRLLLIELDRIRPEKRMDEVTFWRNFNAARPKLFGAVLDAVSGALKRLPDIKLDRMPRMADFARVACAYAEFAGMGANTMLDIIMAHTFRQTQEVLDADPVATAVVEFVRKSGKWTGTASELLSLLNEAHPQQRPDGWPKQGNTLSRRLTVLHSTLSEVGINIRRHKEGNRLLTLESSADSSSASSLSSRSTIHADLRADGVPIASSEGSSRQDGKVAVGKISSAVSSPIKGSNDSRLDDLDDQDDISRLFSGESKSEQIEVEI